MDLNFGRAETKRKCGRCNHKKRVLHLYGKVSRQILEGEVLYDKTNTTSSTLKEVYLTELTFDTFLTNKFYNAFWQCGPNLA